MGWYWNERNLLDKASPCLLGAKTHQPRYGIRRHHKMRPLSQVAAMLQEMLRPASSLASIPPCQFAAGFGQMESV
jgi:hypothetical protein